MVPPKDNIAFAYFYPACSIWVDQLTSGNLPVGKFECFQTPCLMFITFKHRASQCFNYVHKLANVALLTGMIHESNVLFEWYIMTNIPIMKLLLYCNVFPAYYSLITYYTKVKKYIHTQHHLQTINSTEVIQHVLNKNKIRGTK